MSRLQSVKCEKGEQTLAILEQKVRSLLTKLIEVFKHAKGWMTPRRDIIYLIEISFFQKPEDIEFWLIELK